MELHVAVEDEERKGERSDRGRWRRENRHQGPASRHIYLQKKNIAHMNPDNSLKNLIGIDSTTLVNLRS